MQGALSMSKNTATTARSPSFLTSRWTRLAAGSVLVVGGILAATSATRAWAERPDGDGMGVCMHGDRHHRGGPGMGDGAMGMSALGGRGLERMLKEVNANDAQRKQIEQITAAARQDLDKLREGARGLHEQSLAVLTQPKLDAAAAEKLRQQMLAHHDAVSKRMLAAMLDVAKVLTPEQRAKVGEQLKQRMARHADRMARPEGAASGASGPRH
jgi:protein CpxP